MLHTYRHKDRASDEAGQRGAFAPKNDSEKIDLAFMYVGQVSFINSPRYS